MRRVALVLLFALALVPRSASACGAAYPGGPVMCEYPRAANASTSAPIARVSASWAYTSTTMLFGDGRRADLTRHAVFGGLEAPIARKLSLQIGAGGVAGGELVHGAAVDTIGPGWTGFVGVAGRLVDEGEQRPFVQLTGTLSVTHMLTHTADHETPRYTAFDLRAGAIVGKSIGGILTPYVVGRVFGGPTYWRFDGADVTGTDLYKYQLGGGLSLALLERRLDLFAEGVALGESGLAAGLGTTFF